MAAIFVGRRIRSGRDGEKIMVSSRCNFRGHVCFVAIGFGAEIVMMIVFNLIPLIILHSMI